MDFRCPLRFADRAVPVRIACLQITVRNKDLQPAPNLSLAL